MQIQIHSWSEVTRFPIGRRQLDPVIFTRARRVALKMDGRPETDAMMPGSVSAAQSRVIGWVKWNR